MALAPGRGCLGPPSTSNSTLGGSCPFRTYKLSRHDYPSTVMQMVPRCNLLLALLLAVLLVDSHGGDCSCSSSSREEPDKFDDVQNRNCADLTMESVLAKLSPCAADLKVLSLGQPAEVTGDQFDAQVRAHTDPGPRDVFIGTSIPHTHTSAQTWKLGGTRPNPHPCTCQRPLFVSPTLMSTQARFLRRFRLSRV